MNIWLPHHHRMIRMDDLKAFLLEPSGSSFPSGINVLAKAQVAALCGHTWRLGIKFGACLGGMDVQPRWKEVKICLKSEGLKLCTLTVG